MICPYCKNNVSDSNQYCPECGQSIVSKKTKYANTYWEEVNRESGKRNKECKEIANKTSKEERRRNNRKYLSAILLAIFLISFVCGCVKYNNYIKEEKEEVLTGLVGNQFSTHDSHMEGMGWIHHEYWQLTFIDESNLDYEYIETVGPAEENEKPEYKGTYKYTISRSLMGNYSISVNGVTFELKVNDDNTPTGISP